MKAGAVSPTASLPTEYRVQATAASNREDAWRSRGGGGDGGGGCSDGPFWAEG